MNRKANGNDFHDSNTITMISAVGTPTLNPNSAISPRSWLRNGIGASQPRTSVPIALTKPELRRQQHAPDERDRDDGRDPGQQHQRRARGRGPRNVRRTRSAAIRPRHDRARGAEHGVQQRDLRRLQELGRRRAAGRSCAACRARRAGPAGGIWISRMRWNDSTSAHSTGQDHHHEDDDHGGRHERHAGARRRAARGCPARGAASLGARLRRGSEVATSFAYSSPVWISSTVAWRPWPPPPGPCRRSRPPRRSRPAARRAARRAARPGPGRSPSAGSSPRRRPSDCDRRLGVELAQRGLGVDAALELGPRGLELLRVRRVAGADGVLALRREPEPARRSRRSACTRELLRRPRSARRRRCRRSTRTPNWLGSPPAPLSGPTSPLFSAR